jgi:hypothetical protein
MVGEAKKRVGRKILVASIGVASVTYGACSNDAPRTDAAVDVAADVAADVARADDAGARPDGGIDGGGPTGPTDASLDRQFMGNLA